MAVTRTPARPPSPLLLRPFQRFFQLEASGGILLLLCAVIAIAWANSPWRGSYFDLWNTQVTTTAGGFSISKPLLLWINDGLMAIFFFVVGLEIKREILVGELSSVRKASLPLAGAVGGMVVPAALYAALNAGGPGSAGWGIPMATDIAFALGVLALMGGSRAPLPLKIFLTALAIVDDLGAVLVIAIFYTAKMWLPGLFIAGAVLLGLMALNGSGVRRPLPYAVLGLILWVAVLKSGVHATIAGVVLAMTIPATRRIDAPRFLERARELVDEFEEDVHPGESEPTEDQRDAVQALDVMCEQIETPLARLEHALHPWVAFFIMPVFALANAGVTIGGGGGGGLTHPVALGVILGLVVGKQVGVTAFAWLAVRLGIAEIPAGIRWSQLYAVSWLCGIGFTMSLFIANLAFFDPALLESAKLGILAASVLAGSVGALLLWRQPRTELTPPPPPPAPGAAVRTQRA